MDGMQKRSAYLQPAMGLALLMIGVLTLWLLPVVPDLAGVAAVVLGALVLVNEFA